MKIVNQSYHSDVLEKFHIIIDINNIGICKPSGTYTFADTHNASFCFVAASQVGTVLVQMRCSRGREYGQMNIPKTCCLDSVE